MQTGLLSALRTIDSQFNYLAALEIEKKSLSGAMVKMPAIKSADLKLIESISGYFERGEIGQLSLSKFAGLAIGMNTLTIEAIDAFSQRQWPITLLAGGPKNDFNSDFAENVGDIAMQLAGGELTSTGLLEKLQELANSYDPTNIQNPVAHFLSQDGPTSSLVNAITRGGMNVINLSCSSLTLQRTLYRDLAQDQALCDANKKRRLYKANAEMHEKPFTVLLKVVIVLSIAQVLIATLTGSDSPIHGPLTAKGGILNWIVVSYILSILIPRPPALRFRDGSSFIRTPICMFSSFTFTLSCYK